MTAGTKGGGVTGFEDFVRDRGHELTKFAHLLARDRADAEDLVQEALASAYANWRRIERTASPEAYVRRIIVNRHISMWRRHRGRVEPRAELPESTTPDRTAAIDLADALVNVVRRLPAKQRAAVVLRYYADYSDADIAHALGCSEGTVRSQISRAVKTLRDVVGRDDFGVSTPARPAHPATEGSSL